MPWVLIIRRRRRDRPVRAFLSSKVDELSGIGRERHTAGRSAGRNKVVPYAHSFLRKRNTNRRDREEGAASVHRHRCRLRGISHHVRAASSPTATCLRVSLLASLVIATLVCGKSDAGRAFCYAVVGLGIACAVLILITRAYVSVSTAEVNAFTAHLRGRGASVGAAILPARVTFAREFADETVGCVRLSQRTAAAALLLDLQDKEWEVPGARERTGEAPREAQQALPCGRTAFLPREKTKSRRLPRMPGGRITDEDIQKVRDASDIVAVFSERVPVKQRGRDFWCCCPFHNEKSPSCKIDPALQLWHCFGCGEGGDVFAFIMKAEDLSFPEAVHRLAERAHIDIVEVGGKPAAPASKKARLKDICKATAEFYHLQLMRWKSPEASAAREYLSGRDLGGKVPRDWNLGFAPGRGVLTRHLSSKGFKADEMVEANVQP